MSLGRIGTIVRLELTQRMRSIAWYVLLGVFAFLLLIVTVLAFLSTRGQGVNGASVYSIVVYFVLLLVVLVSPTLSGNAINGDRDAATLAPVQVTLATTGEIVAGKVLAAWTTGLAFLAVAVPFILAAMLAGGVSVATLAVSLVVLVVEIGIVAAIGVGLSGILARPLFSVASTYLVVSAFVIGTLIAFGLGGTAIRSEATSDTRWMLYDEQTGMPLVPSECGPWQHETYEVPRYDYVWGLLAANPFVILADATPVAFDKQGYPVDLFGQIKVGVRYTQLPPELEYVYDECDPAQDEDVPTPAEIVASTVPSWFVGLALQLIIAAGLLWWCGARTRTPARRLPPGTRIA